MAKPKQNVFFSNPADSSSLVSKNPPLQTSAADDTVTLSCEYSGIWQYTVHWYSQPPGQALEYLLQKHTSGGDNKENAAGGRISDSTDSVEKISRLKISKLQLSDSAVYYCGLSRSTAQWIRTRRELSKNLNVVRISDTVTQNTERTVQKPELGEDFRHSDTVHGESCTKTWTWWRLQTQWYRTRRELFKNLNMVRNADTVIQNPERAAQKPGYGEDCSF